MLKGESQKALTDAEGREKNMVSYVFCASQSEAAGEREEEEKKCLKTECAVGVEH